MKKKHMDFIKLGVVGVIVICISLFLFFIENMYLIGLWLIGFGIFIISIGLLDLLEIKNKKVTILVLLIMFGFILFSIPISLSLIIPNMGILMTTLIVTSAIAFIILIIILEYQKNKVKG